MGHLGGGSFILPQESPKILENHSWKRPIEAIESSSPAAQDRIIPVHPSRATMETLHLQPLSVSGPVLNHPPSEKALPISNQNPPLLTS